MRHWYAGDYSHQPDDARQNTPDLSGTGRSLLRFRNPNGLPNRVRAASLVMHYTATPYYVYHYRTDEADAFGATMLRHPNNSSVNYWNEESVRWDWLGHFSLDNLRVSPNSFHLKMRDTDLSWCIAQEPYEVGGRVRSDCSYWSGTELRMRIGSGSSVDMPADIVPVTLTSGELSLLSFTQQGVSGGLVNFLFTLSDEEQSDTSRNRLHFPEDGPIKWYYFLSKQHPWAGQDSRYLPRLWLVW